MAWNYGHGTCAIQTGIRERRKQRAFSINQIMIWLENSFRSIIIGYWNDLLRLPSSRQNSFASKYESFKFWPNFMKFISESLTVKWKNLIKNNPMEFVFFLSLFLTLFAKSEMGIHYYNCFFLIPLTFKSYFFM